jgi:predicted NodU family carbamoyl transferase
MEILSGYLLFKIKLFSWDRHGEYTLLQNLERGVGEGALDWDIAASVQSTLEHILLSLATWLQSRNRVDNLAYAGGVALNCVANTKIKRFTPFKNIAIQPAAGDAGCALGAAALILVLYGKMLI